MNFAEAVDAVLSVIKRPDKTAEAGVIVNAVLSRSILKTEFSKDLVETSIPLDSSLYTQTIDLSALASPLVRFRKWKYVKMFGATRYLNYIDPQNVFVPGGWQQQDGYYMIGSSMTIIPSSSASSLLVGYYQYAPNLTGTEAHWFLDICPYAIVYQAIGELLITMGDAANGKIYKAMGDDMYKIAVNDFKDQITY